jgi:hypothetical protein
MFSSFLKWVYANNEHTPIFDLKAPQAAGFAGILIIPWVSAFVKRKM